MHSQWLALKTRQGIPVVERGQLFHHFVLKITVWKNSLSVDITFGVRDKITKRSTSDKQLPLNLMVVVMLPVQLNFTISFSKTKSCHLCHCQTEWHVPCNIWTFNVQDASNTFTTDFGTRGGTQEAKMWIYYKTTDGFNAQYLILATLSCALP